MGAITSINLLDPGRTYSYADYLKWRLDEYVELIRGKVFRMSPAPSRIHQEVSMRLSSTFFNHLKGDICQVYAAPFDVRLFPKSSENDIYTVVQPDICIVRDQNKLDEKGCLGAPDLVVEILSPNSSQKDAREKYDLYEEAGVREYWMIHPNEKLVDVYLLEEGKFAFQKKFVATDQINVSILSDFKIDLKEIFPK